MPDRWIIGEGLHDDAGYIVHTEEPRFIAEFIDEELASPEQVLAPLVFSCENGVLILNIVTFDSEFPKPGSDAFLEIMHQAEHALEYWFERMEEEGDD